MTEKECKLTYREGRRIAELAQEPFNKAKRATFWITVLGFVAIFALMSLDNMFPPEINPNAIEAGFTAAQWDFIRGSANMALACGALLGFVFSILALQIALTVLQGGITKGWLKAANEEEKE